MLASSGDKIPPCGVPVLVSSKSPSSVMIPALRNALTRASTRLSLTRDAPGPSGPCGRSGRSTPRYPHPAPSGSPGCRRGGSRRSRRVRAARAGTRRRPARSRPRKWVPAPAFNAAWTTRSATVGIPSRRSFPTPPGFGIFRSRTGCGRNVPALQLCPQLVQERRPHPPRSRSGRQCTPSDPAVRAPAVAPRPGPTPRSASPGHARG